MCRFPVCFVSEKGCHSYNAFLSAEQAGVSAKNDEPVIFFRKFAVEVDGDIISLINIYPKSIVLELLSYLVQECMVGIEHGKLVYDSRHRYIIFRR